jgi:hypothetical protein
VEPLRPETSPGKNCFPKISLFTVIPIVFLRR